MVRVAAAAVAWNTYTPNPMSDTTPPVTNHPGTLPDPLANVWYNHSNHIPSMDRGCAQGTWLG